MPFSTTDILLGGVVPLLIAAGTLILLRRSLATGLGKYYPAAIALLAGSMAGCALLGLIPWIPATHWHWLPLAMVVAAVVGPVACAEDVGAFGRVGLNLIIAVTAAWLLVPTWGDLTPSRTMHIVVVVIYVVGLASLLEPLTKRFPGPLLPAILWGTMTTTAVVLALSGSLRFAQIALSGAAALFGIMLVACGKPSENRLTGVSPIFATLTVGCLLIGRVNSFSEMPLVFYMLVPLAPLCLWAYVAGPLLRLPWK